MEAAVDSALQGIVGPARELFGVELGAQSRSRLGAFLAELVKWNARINLTSIIEPVAMAELHVLDSLAISPHVPRGSRLLDIGTGGGFPGVPIAITRPDLEVELVDRTEKKILFLKSALARLGVANAYARHLRAEGRPGAEGLEEVDVAVSRAFTAPPAWFHLARAYVREGGKVIAMLGSERPSAADLTAIQSEPGDRLEVIDYRLPGGSQRGLIVLHTAEASSAAEPGGEAAGR